MGALRTLLSRACRPALRAGLVIGSSFIVAPSALLALPQGGYTTDKHPDLGLTFPRARDYEEQAIPPDETFIVLAYAEKVPERARDKKAIRPEMSFVWIDFLPDAPPQATSSGTGVPGEPGGTGGTGGGAGAGDGGKSAPPASESKPEAQINSLERWIEKRLPQWDLGPAVDGKERNGYTAREHVLQRKKKVTGNAAGWVYAWRSPKRTIAVLGICAEDDFKEEVKIWRTTAEKIDFKEPEEQSTEKLERMYARTTLLDPEFRINVRKKLVRGWKAEDTEHFIVIYDTPDQPLMKKIFRDIELLRLEYMKLFPPVGELNAVSTVRVCKSRDEYLSYYGNPSSAGFWNSDTEELVLYDAEKMDRAHRISDADTFIVLYHEAFHQYIHYSTGELPPHSWFNEGHGDFFSGATVRDGKMRSIGVNPWRVRTIKLAVEMRKFAPWKEIIRWEQAQYYQNGGVNYAEGWSMIYFLRMSKAVEKSSSWSKILPTYFDVLKKSYAEGLSALEAAGKKDDKIARAKAGLEARTKAVDAAFADVDLDAIENAWISFVDGLEEPK